MSTPTRRLVMAVVLSGVALPALAALSDSEARLVAGKSGLAEDAAPIQLADNDDDDNRWWRKDGRRGDHDHRRGRHHDHDDDDDHDDDHDDDDDDDRRSAPRRTGPAPAQNPLIGAPRATTN